MGGVIGSAIGMIEQTRTDTPADHGPYIVQNIWAHHNTIDLSTDGNNNGAVQDTGSTVIFTSRNNRFDFNTYTLGGGNPSPFWWNNTSGGKTFWQGFGLDTNGVFH